MRIGIVGAGVIAALYAEAIARSEGLELVAVTDVLPGRADEFAARHGGASRESLAALLAGDDVELVVNLTAPQAHAEVTAAALEAGKHVHSEKPLALRYDEAKELVELAARRGLLLGCAPSTLLGEAQQTAWKLVREGALGAVRLVYAEANWGRIESWHPAPQSLYAVGAFVDVGVYPLTIVTAMFGPARRVTAYGAMLQPERVTTGGEPFHLKSPDFVVALVELESGVIVRLTATFYAGPGKQRGLELYGDDGQLYLANWGEADSRLELAAAGEYEPVALLRDPYRGIDWGRALVDLAEAAREGRQPRASGEHAAHIVEILDAAERSRTSGGGAVEVRSTFTTPAPLEWAASGGAAADALRPAGKVGS